MMSRSHDLFHPELKMTHFSNRTELEKKRYFTGANSYLIIQTFVSIFATIIWNAAAAE